MQNSGTSSPVDPVRYLSVDEVAAIHERLLDRFGGSPGLRDPGLLEIALFRPHTGHYRDVVAMGAALLESLLVNRPFDDGNARTAFFAVDVFLRLNGQQIRADAREVHQVLGEFMQRQIADFKHLEPWLRRYTVRLPR
jgi:death on curing protein